MTIRKHLATTVVALLTLTFSLGAAADWQAEEGNRLQQRAEKAIEKVRTKVERRSSAATRISRTPTQWRYGPELPGSLPASAVLTARAS
jgi:hypothetical protein